MKIAYITGDIRPNGNFSFFHDLLANYPVPSQHEFHRIYLVSPNWERGLVTYLKSRHLEVRSCFEEFQSSTDSYWKKIDEDLKDIDVVISGNITNLDEVLPPQLKKRVISVSLAEQGYRTSTGSYGSFYKDRFDLAAVSNAAVLAFPEHVRHNVKVLHSGIDTDRMSTITPRNTLRSSWFPGRHKDMKIILFIGTNNESKGYAKAIKSLDHLSKEYHLMFLSESKDLSVPEHLYSRVHFCNPTYHVGDIYRACDVFLLPTAHEGMSMSLLEAWYTSIPTVTTRHNTIKELIADNQDVDFGPLLDVECSSEDIAEFVQSAQPNQDLHNMVLKKYMASNMVDRWQQFLTSGS